ncbi:bacteriophage T4 gp5 trimerization domain-containing protein, partial [Psychrobacter celer]
MFNDDAGFELVNLQAQRDLNSLVKNDETRRVNRDRTTTIDKDETITVHGKRTEVVDKDETITIHQNRTEVVDKDETITIHQNRQERVDENETLDIGGNRTETVHKSEQILIKGNRDKTVKGNDTLNVEKDRKENIDKSRSLTVDRTNTEFVKLGKSVTVGLGYATQVGTVMNTAVGIMQTEQIGRIKKSFVGKSYSITAGDEFKITVGKSSLVMNADGSIIITGSSIVTQAEGVNKVIGKDVLINPPGAVDESEPDYLNDDPPEYDENGDPILGSDNGHINRTKTNADFAKETAMMNGRFSDIAGKLNLVFKVNDKGHNIVCIPAGNEDCKPRANERYATKAEASEGMKNLAMDVMPIPGGKGFQVVAKKTGQVIGNFKDAKSARKAVEDVKIRNNNQIDDDLGNKPSGRPEYNGSYVNEIKSISSKQLDKKFKHATDFGITTTKKNPRTLKQFESAIKNHMVSPDTASKGTYGFVSDSKVFYNKSTHNV